MLSKVQIVGLNTSNIMYRKSPLFRHFLAVFSLYREPSTYISTAVTNKPKVAKLGRLAK